MPVQSVELQGRTVEHFDAIPAVLKHLTPIGSAKIKPPTQLSPKPDISAVEVTANSAPQAVGLRGRITRFIEKFVLVSNSLTN